jgi:hypothetical protein
LKAVKKNSALGGIKKELITAELPASGTPQENTDGWFLMKDP